MQPSTASAPTDYASQPARPPPRPPLPPRRPYRDRHSPSSCKGLGRGTAQQRQWITLRFFRLRVAAIVTAGIAGEPIALWALYRASERPWQRPTVLVATLILLLAVAAAPIGAYADRVAQFLDQTLEKRTRAGRTW